MRYFIELTKPDNRVTQILHTLIPPENAEYKYVEISEQQKKAFKYNQPTKHHYLTYSDNEFKWLTDKTTTELNEYYSEQARKHRDQLLQETDWTQLPDVSEQIREKYKRYRQDLRDITLQAGFPNIVTWPQKPV